MTEQLKKIILILIPVWAILMFMFTNWKGALLLYSLYPTSPILMLAIGVSVFIAVVISVYLIQSRKISFR